MQRSRNPKLSDMARTIMQQSVAIAKKQYIYIHHVRNLDPKLTEKRRIENAMTPMRARIVAETSRPKGPPPAAPIAKSQIAPQYTNSHPSSVFLELTRSFHWKPYTITSDSMERKPLRPWKQGHLNRDVTGQCRKARGEFVDAIKLVTDALRGCTRGGYACHSRMAIAEGWGREAAMAIARRSSAATKAKTHRAGRRPAGDWAAGPPAPGLTRERHGPGVLPPVRTWQREFESGRPRV